MTEPDEQTEAQKNHTAMKHALKMIDRCEEHINDLNSFLTMLLTTLGLEQLPQEEIPSAVKVMMEMMKAQGQFLDKSTEDNAKLREMLWLRHGCVFSLYGDDGEQQCGACGLDFKRDPVERINERMNNDRPPKD